MVMYPLLVLKLLYYTIQHEGGRHIDFRQMSISPIQTTARRFLAYMLSRALATTATSNTYITFFTLCFSELSLV